MLFWLPAILVAAVYRSSASIAALNVASLTGTGLLPVISWRTHKRMPRWGWALAGVYVLGPTAILVSWAFDHIPPAAGLPEGWGLASHNVVPATSGDFMVCHSEWDDFVGALGHDSLTSSRTFASAIGGERSQDEACCCRLPGGPEVLVFRTELSRSPKTYVYIQPPFIGVDCCLCS